MGYNSWIQSFIQEHEGEPIAKVIADLYEKEKDLPIEYLSLFVDYCNYYM